MLPDLDVPHGLLEPQKIQQRLRRLNTNGNFREFGRAHDVFRAISK